MFRLSAKGMKLGFKLIIIIDLEPGQYDWDRPGILTILKDVKRF